ncbi:hypothetical protein AAA799N04_00544 [Marine Group I thaumarchaeote SCGC AAA799-N04]|uniref:Uncharacterized protein n=1 Tax=Marine Group I thaumarchaeote SCGC AAA799-N04 TaxID=1502293 RepID=A0A081RNV1_9ARCH|nr:hypothetical protein AAA799N04_00544 [Marine Group I thaumarchaeote SCGC AAA799-N04]
MEYKKTAFTVGTILLFGMATSFGFQTVLSQPEHFDDTKQSDIQSVDLLDRKGKPATWYLGKNLIPGDQFTYKICDMILIIPESPEHCYQLSLEFVDILKSPHGDVWVVQAVMDHQDRKTYSIFQLSAATFDITTDGTSIPYADSVSRTLFWIGKFANEFDEMPLAIGKSWGKIATYTAPETDLVIRNKEVIALDDNNQQFQTFALGYNLIEQSIINISDDFPFPIKAIIYKPTASHQNIPLQFTIELVNHTNTNNFLDDFSQPTFPNQNEFSESLDNFEEDLLFNENLNNDADDIIDNNELNMTSRFKEDNSDSIDTNYLDAINLEELFEMFLNEHFGDDNHDEQIIDFAVFLDFLNETDSTINDLQNFTDP